MQHCNTVIILGILTPLVVAFWNSSFAFGSLYIYPEAPKLRAIILTLSGFTSAALLFLLMPYMNRYYQEGSTCCVILWRLLLYPISFVTVSSWIGVWVLWDVYTGTGLKSNLFSHFIGIIILWFSRTSCSILCSPYVVGLDRFLRNFHYYSRFELHVNQTFSLKAIDLIITVFISGVGVVSFWRGTWGILDNILFPDNIILSASVSVGIGYAVAVLFFSICNAYRNFALNQVRIFRHFLECLWIYLSGAGTVLSWRGIWFLFDSYIFPDSVERRTLVLHVVAVFGLYFGRCFSCVIASPGLGCSSGFDGTKDLHGLDMGQLVFVDELSSALVMPLTIQLEGDVQNVEDTSGGNNPSNFSASNRKISNQVAPIQAPG